MDQLPEQVSCCVCKYPAILDKENKAYICTVCGTEAWTDERKLIEYQQTVMGLDTREARKAERARIRKEYLSHINRPIISEILPIHPFPAGGGGSNNAKRNKTKPNKGTVNKWEVDKT